jgi:hypothetical protein
MYLCLPLYFSYVQQQNFWNVCIEKNLFLLFYVYVICIMTSSIS